VSGKYKEHIIAFAREKDGKAIIVAAPRFLTKVVDETQAPIGESVWKDTAIELPKSLNTGNWQQVFSEKSVVSEGKLFARDIFGEFPLGLLIKA
jgi:(1->4)-alpha-D-glucan 1-alpha-D-glucosylmutase